MLIIQLEFKQFIKKRNIKVQYLSCQSYNKIFKQRFEKYIKTIDDEKKYSNAVF